MALKNEMEGFNDLFYGGNPTYVPSENDTNTILNEIVTLFNPLRIH